MEFTLRGVLKDGGWHNDEQLNDMDTEQKRNRLIGLLSDTSNRDVGYYQGFDNQQLIDKGAVTAFLRKSGFIDEDLKKETDDQQRNRLIVLLNQRTDEPVPFLQSKSNFELLQMAEMFVLAGNKIVEILKFEWELNEAQVINLPKLIHKEECIVNESQDQIMRTVSYSQSVSDSYSFSIEAGFEIDGSVSYTGGIGLPFVGVEGNLELDLSTSLTFDTNKEQFIQKDFSDSFQINIKPNTETTISVFSLRDKLNVKFNVNVRMANKSEKWLKGLWNGTQTGYAQITRKDKPLEKKK